MSGGEQQPAAGAGRIGTAARRIVRRVNADPGIDGQRLYFDAHGDLIAAVATREAHGLPVGQYAVMRITGTMPSQRGVQEELDALALAEAITPPTGDPRDRGDAVHAAAVAIEQDWAGDDDAGRPRRITDPASAKAVLHGAGRPSHRPGHTSQEERA